MALEKWILKWKFFNILKTLKDHISVSFEDKKLRGVSFCAKFDNQNKFRVIDKV